MSRPNRCIKDENGEDVWVVRSSVVIPIVFKYDKITGNIYTLIEQRGPAVTHTGEWCCPCGYIDWDETMEEACQREVMEETGTELNLSDIKLFDVNTDKFSKNQSVDHWYVCWTNQDFNLDKVETKDEILDLHWLKVAILKKEHFRYLTIYKNDIERGKGKWAFKRHTEYIIRMLKSEFNNCLISEV